jgi:transposase
MTLIRHLAALGQGSILSITASTKAALRAIARRWLTLDAEISAHDSRGFDGILRAGHARSRKDLHGDRS